MPAFGEDGERVQGAPSVVGSERAARSSDASGVQLHSTARLRTEAGRGAESNESADQQAPSAGSRATWGTDLQDFGVKFEPNSAVPTALEILREAAAWAEARGMSVWARHDLLETDFTIAADAGELVLGYAGSEPVATMLLQVSDALYWPEAAPGSALYVHKVAIRRAAAGQGWLERLIGFADDEARARGIRFLRLDTVPRPVMQAMYERLGFAVVDAQPPIVKGRPMLRMQKAL